MVMVRELESAHAASQHLRISYAVDSKAGTCEHEHNLYPTCAALYPRSCSRQLAVGMLFARDCQWDRVRHWHERLPAICLYLLGRHKS
jgi:hypothetical protein